MSDFNNIRIKLSFGCGYSGANQEDEELLSDYWTEEDWSNLSEQEKDKWLHEFWLYWKCEYETGGVWLEGD